MSNIIKFLICSITLTLLTSFTLHGYVDAREYAPSENDIKNDKYIYHFTDEDYEQYADIILDDSESPTITPRMAPAVPFLASAVFSILAKQGVKTAVKSISKHALQRAGQKGITKTMMANTIKNGVKYTDRNTGAKILYDKITGTTLVVKNNNVVTSYIQKTPKKVRRKGH
ncbi:hypothetical protein [Macrococcoides canis]|uniref:DUF4258 domain-containing protein n=1 Tax=Macrococcoides canis TaxID=1855823 RepID=A0AAE7C0P1_9STAP|nr:hypothetical protein [Macrococcus canis]QIH79077.1 hypothetical protein GTN30_10520 [Macrococcus canis]QNR08601.1 hypothetical protein GL258_10265 [Macrococcus canis]